MDNTEAIKYLKHIRDEWTIKDSFYFQALEKAIEALQIVEYVQSCLEKHPKKGGAE